MVSTACLCGMLTLCFKNASFISVENGAINSQLNSMFDFIFYGKYSNLHYRNCVELLKST